MTESSQHEASSQMSHRFLLALRSLSIIEGISTLFLFGIAMPLKYFWAMPMAVRIAGGIHGGLFIALVLMFALGVSRIPIAQGVAIKGSLAAIIPFGPFFFDHRLKKVAEQT